MVLIFLLKLTEIAFIGMCSRRVPPKRDIYVQHLGLFGTRKILAGIITIQKQKYE